MLPPEVTQLARLAAEALLARGRREDDAAAADLLLRAGADDAVADLLLTLARRDLARGAFHTAGRLIDDLDRTGLRRAAAAVERVRLLCLRGRAREALAVAGPACLKRPRVANTCRSSPCTSPGPRCRPVAGTTCTSTSTAPDVRTTRGPRPSWPTLHTGPAGSTTRANTQRRPSRGAEAAGNAERLCDALVVHAKVLRLEDTRAARVLFDRAAQVAAEHGLVDARVEAMLGQATLEMLESESTQRLEAARQVAEQAGLVGQLTAIDMLRVDALVVKEGPAAAVPLARDVLERGPGAGDARGCDRWSLRPGPRGGSSRRPEP